MVMVCHSRSESSIDASQLSHFASTFFSLFFPILYPFSSFGVEQLRGLVRDG